MRFLSPNKPAGFTLVELLIVIPVVMMVLTVFIGALITMSSEVAKTQGENKLTYDTQSALDTIERDVRLSANFLAVNEIAVSSPLSYANSAVAVNDFKNNGTNGEMLILRTLATDRNPLNPARELIYLDTGGGCGTNQKIIANYYYTNVIYFTKTEGTNKSLWKRTLLPTLASGTSTCGTPWQRPSCSPTATKGATCKVDDVKLLDNVSNFSIDYRYNASDATAVSDAKSTAVSETNRTILLRSISAVQVNITAARTVGGKDISHSGTILTTRLNIPYESSTGP